MAQHSKRLVDLPSSDPMLVCCVCECLLDKPQLLSCLHSCCLNCLQTSRAHDQPAKPTCPICQEVSSDVSCNVVIGSRVRRYEAIANSGFCAMCADRGNGDQHAEAWCTPCSMSFCETCLPYHRSCHRTHMTIPIEDVKSWDEVFPTPSPLCSRHEKPFDFVCFSCKTCCCVDCWPSCAQIKHDIKHINDTVVTSYIESTQGEVTSLARTLRGKTNLLCKRKQLADALKSDLQNDLKKLQNSKLLLLKVIDDVCVTAESRLRDTYDSLGATADAISSSSETMERKVSHTAEYSLYVAKSGAATGLLMQEQRLSSRMKALCSELDKLGQPLEAGQYVSFDPTLPDDEAQLIDIVTSWIGSPRAMTDDLCERKAQSKSSTVNIAATAQEQVKQTYPVDSVKCVRPASDNPLFAERKSSAVDDLTNRTKVALPTAISSQATLSVGIIGDDTPAAAAVGYSSGTMSKIPSSKDSSSSESDTTTFSTVLQEALAHFRQCVQLHTFRMVSLDIGVIGAPGSGASTFINTIRGLKPADLGAATVGIGEPTKDPTQYEHPQNSTFKLWDLPSIQDYGSSRSTYLKMINLQKYDFLVLICSHRISEDLLWLAKEVQRMGKPCYFVRTKVDQDVSYDLEDFQETHCEEKLLKHIKDDIVSQLAKCGFKEPPVFLVCKNPHLYDFPAFENRVLDDLPDHKKKKLLLTTRTHLEEQVRKMIPKNI